MNQRMILRLARPRLWLALCAASCLSATSAGAASVTIQMSARVQESCTASLAASAAVTGSQAQGVVNARCNTRFDLFLHYPSNIGPVVVNYEGRQAASDTGVVELARDAAPMMVSAPFVLEALGAPEDLAAAPLTLQIAPRGL